MTEATLSLDAKMDDEVGDRVKAWEAASETRLDLSKPLVVRLDGCAFHTYARGFRKPCDELIYRPMALTTQDLVQKFNASLGYTESDEITLVFLPQRPDKEGKINGLYNYRVQKVCSILASYAGVRFNHHSRELATEAASLQAVADGKLDAKILERMKAGVAMFDARAFNTPDLVGAVESVYWRHRYDCHRNSVFALGFAHFSHKQLHKKGTGAILNMLRQIDVRYSDLPAEFRFGVFVKKKAVRHVTEGNGQEPNVPLEFVRTEIAAWSSAWEGTIEERVALLTNKYVNQEEFDAWKPNRS